MHYLHTFELSPRHHLLVQVHLFSFPHNLLGLEVPVIVNDGISISMTAHFFIDNHCAIWLYKCFLFKVRSSIKKTHMQGNVKKKWIAELCTLLLPHTE